ncbi:MAG: hypothetical protein OZSIB_2362 [Candidatus Ozemobacter sibiricus]|uniref:Uncharacterized protein n=1 Tax=Candidatus Ozemobacter sibiricus TaxID=2268124 RepID=A0A367ZS67_9BACT|nr:MAG: hypothetical protein OZSIB_2362 [Candidatus Ozemobacter sibiricus]
MPEAFGDISVAGKFHEVMPTNNCELILDHFIENVHYFLSWP